MQTSVISFHDRAQAALDDPTLKIAIDRTTGNAEKKRAVAVAAFPQFEATRDLGKRIKDHVVANLDHYLLEFERNAIASGAKVHWAATAEEASRIVVELCQQAKAKRVTRVKSMLGEEIGLPHALDEAGFERYETDLAEHIVQLAGDRPSHIVWPSMHRTREQVSALFKQSHQQPHTEETIEAMVESALDHARLLEDNDFREFKISVKASDVFLAVAAYQGLAEACDYPLHLGVTEAGGLMTGTVKSAIGIGSLLWAGIGDTIRVSLSADPVEEIRVGFDILKSLNLRHRGVNVISCPSCARQGFDVIKTVAIIEERLKHITTPMSLSIIGCVVNGPGEAAQTDLGFTGGGAGSGMVYVAGKPDHKMDNDRLVDHIVELVEKRAAEIEAKRENPTPGATAPIRGKH